MCVCDVRVRPCEDPLKFPGGWWLVVGGGDMIFALLGPLGHAGFVCLQHLIPVYHCLRSLARRSARAYACYRLWLRAVASGAVQLASHRPAITVEHWVAAVRGFLHFCGAGYVLQALRARTQDSICCHPSHSMSTM